MSRHVPRRWRPVLPIAFVAPLAGLSALRLAQRGAVPWAAVAGVAVVTAVVAGPVAWAARSRIPEGRRSRLALVAGGVVLLLAPVVLGTVLAGDVPLLPVLDVLTVGAFAGILIVVVAERTVVPERLRGSA